jgi:hypothetical protein
MPGIKHLQARAPDDSPLRSPKPGFPGSRINASWLAACSTLPGTGPLVTAFRSPTTVAAFRLPPFRGQCSQPVTSRPLGSFPCPVRPRLNNHAPGLLRWRLLHCLGPVTLPLPGPACSTAPSPLPSGSFCSLGIKAFNRACYLPGPPGESARSPFAPRCPFSKVGAADHRSRAATFPPACCSSNLLEPSSLCSESAFPSISFGLGSTLFLNLYFVYFLMLAGEYEWTGCG